MSLEVKPCPRCRVDNPTLNKFCDSCGESLTEPAPSPPSDTSPSPLAPDFTTLPQAGRSGQSFEEVAASQPPAQRERPIPRRPVPVRHPLLPSGFPYFMRSVTAILAMVFMVGACAWLLIYSRHLQGPQFLGPRLAARYLDALVANDYATAYGMISDASRSIFSMEEFRTSRDPTPWTWSNLQTAAVEPGAVVLQYDLKVEGRPAIRDTIVFVREGKRWARPYNWPALKKAEKAFAANSPDLAMIAAQEAMHLDPRDPMARGYICEAAYYLKLADQVEPACRTAIELAARYPSKMTPRSLYHLHALLGDTYKNALKNYGAAIEHYTTTLGFSLSAPERCELLLARSDAYVLNAQPAGAREDLAAAGRVCTRREDLDHIKKRTVELSSR